MNRNEYVQEWGNLKTLAMHIDDERAKVISEINAFASEYAHNIDGRDVVIVEQLVRFLSNDLS